jgi:putative addiction module component (TIGR02574 family)
MTAALLLEEALKLPKREREQLCSKLQDSLDSEQATELLRRLDTHRTHPEQVVSREELEAKWQRKWDWKP